MDDFDLASDFEQLRRDIARATRKPEGPAPTGACLFCGKTLPHEHRWCGADCRDDWQKAQHHAQEHPPCA